MMDFCPAAAWSATTGFVGIERTGFHLPSAGNALNTVRNLRKCELSVSEAAASPGASPCSATLFKAFTASLRDAIGSTSTSGVEVVPAIDEPRAPLP